MTDLKTIFVPIPSAAPQASPIAVAAALAREFAGHLECDYVESASPATDALPAMGSPGQMMAAQEMVARRVAHIEQQAAELEDIFARRCREAGLRLLDGPDQIGSGSPTALWRRRRGAYGEVAATRACAFDLTVTACPGDNGSARIAQEVAEAALLDSGRPVLMVPHTVNGTPGRHAVIAWRPSVQAWRAVSGALPLLARSSRVTVLTVGDRAADDGSCEALLTYLAMHGIQATRRTTELNGSIGECLLAATSQEDGDLLVMGGYSHSRLRERVLNGATRHVLGHAAATSVLMAH